MTIVSNDISVWVMAARPRTLTAGLSPVVLGAALSHDAGLFRPWVSLFALLSCLLLQIGTNLANDYFDAKNKIDGENRVGPVRVTQTGLIPPHRVKAAFLFCFCLAALLGLPLVLEGGLPILAIGILSLVFAYLYTGGPYPLAYYGMGEALAFIFYGLVATGGVYYLNTQQLHVDGLVTGAGLGFLAALLMGINNLRDIHTDRAAGKHTVAVMLGENGARCFVAMLLLAALCTPALFVLVNPDQPWVLLASAGVVPFLPRFIWIITAPVDAGFNRILAAAGQYLFVYAVLFSAGVLL